MELLSFFLPREDIAGLEVGDETLRLLLLREKGGKFFVLGSNEVDLPKGAASGGVIKSREKVVAAFKKLRSSGKPRRVKTPNIIVSFGQKHIWSQVFDFPPLKDEELAAAVSLNAQSFSPIPWSESYIDWQKIPEGEPGRPEARIFVLVSMIRKQVIDPWLDVMKEAGFQVVALESKAASLSRFALFPSKKPRLLIYEETEGLVFAVFEQGFLYYEEFISWHELNLRLGKDSSKREDDALFKFLNLKIRQIENFIQTKFPGHFPQGILMALKNEKTFSKFKERLKEVDLEIELLELPLEKAPIKTTLWATCFGAARRGLIPRAQDTFNSLMPIGTEEAFFEAKRVAFVSALNLIISALFIFYALIFGGSFLLLSYIENGITRSLELQSRLPAPEDAAFLEEKTREINEQSAKIIQIQEQTFSNVAFLRDLNQVRAPGIIIKTVSHNIINGATNLAGEAATREALLEYKRRLESSPGFSDVAVPIQTFGARENIPFSITLKYEPKKRYGLDYTPDRPVL